MSRKIRCLAAVLVLALLTAGTARARSPHAHPGSSGFFDALWQWLAGRCDPGLWEKAGSDMDPNGLMNKEGSSMDPNGLMNKEGGSMDPNGRTLPHPTPSSGTEAGGDMDPDGRS